MTRSFSPDRPALWRLDHWRADPAGAATTLALGLAPLLAMVDALALAPLLALLATVYLATGGWRRLAERRWAAPLTAPQAVTLAAFFVWLLATVLWAPDHLFALRSAAMTLGCILGGLVVTEAMRRLPAPALDAVLSALVCGLLVSLVLLLVVQAIQRFAIDPIGPYGDRALRLALRMDRGTTFAALMLGPAAIGAWRQRRWRTAVLLLLLAIPAIGLSRDLAAKMSLAIGLPLFALALWRARAVAFVVTLAVVAAILAAPLAARLLPPPEQSIHWTWLPRSAHHRLTIWRFAGGHIVERPWAGWGLEASRQLGGGVHLKLVDPAGQPVDEELMPLHPHDAPLQLWLELGGIGAVLLAAFVGLVGLRLAATAAGLSGAAAVVGLAVAFLVSSVSYGFWQSWWQSSLWLAAGVLGALGDRVALVALDKRERLG
jgi:exopolysaccharide production protein ExoQ